MGQNARAYADNSVALGNGSVATEANTVSVGSAGNEHRITNLAEGINGTDAVNVNQLNRELAHVGAKSAALAALHPLDNDGDTKLTFSAGAGSYHGSQAVAIGAFWQPTDHIMVNAGVASNAGDTMGNIGISFALDRSNTPKISSKRAMAAKIEQLETENKAKDAKVADLENRLAKIEAMLTDCTKA